MAGSPWATLVAVALGVLLSTVGRIWAAEGFSWKVTAERLENGLQVLILEDHRANALSFQLWYRVGSRNEQIGATGLAHLFEHLMFRGSKEFGPGEFSRLIQERGGTHNAFTREDSTTYFETIAASELALVSRLEADRMANTILDEEVLGAEQKIVMEERRLRVADDPASELYEQLRAAAFTAHPYGWPVIGWMSDLERVALSDALEFRKTYYAPNNAVAVLVGDVTPQRAIATVKEAFAGIAPGPAAAPVRALEPPQKGERRIHLRRAASLPVIVAAYHVPNYESEDGFELSLLATVLGEGRSSRLQRALVEDKTLALWVDASYDRLSVDPALFTVALRVAPGRKWEDAEAALYEALEAIKNEPPAPRELERAKNLVESSFVFSQDSLFYRGFQLGLYATLGDWELIKQVIPGIRAVTAEGVRKAARKYLTETNRTVGVLIPAQQPGT